MAIEIRLATAAAGFLAAALFSTAGGPSLSSAGFAPESRTTDLVGHACQVDPPHRDAASLDRQTKSCAGFGGARAIVSAERAEVSLGFEWSPYERTEDVLRNWGLGYKLEWRGIDTARGFEPYAATIRILFNDQAGAASDRPVLAVLRIRRGEACLVALVDIAANRDAYGIGRRIADERARAFICGRDAPRIGGAVTGRTTDLLARL